MANKIKITVKTEQHLMLPSLPNFIRTEAGEPSPIQNFSQDQLREIGEQWTEALMRKARDKRGKDMVQINKNISNW